MPAGTCSMELRLREITFQAMILLISRYFNLSYEISAIHYINKCNFLPLVKRNFNSKCSCICVSIGVNQHFKNDSFDNEGATEYSRVNALPCTIAAFMRYTVYI